MEPLISLRLMNHHYNDKLLDELFEVLLRQPGCLDEVWLSTEYGFPPMSIHEKSAEAMIGVAKRFREHNIRVSLQIANSLGHGDYLRHMDFRGITWQQMVGIDGTVFPYGNCPRDKDFLAYQGESARAYGRCEPDILFIDDDLRMHHHSPVEYGCFCEGCLQEMQNQWGLSFTREELAENLRLTTIEGASWRERLVLFNQESLSIVTRAIAEGTKQTSPNTIGGIQSATPDWNIYSGTTLDSVFDVLYEVFGKPPFTRPGGGFYTDHEPRGMVVKALSISSHIANLPEYVTNIRPEVESLPHCVLGKSPHGTALESAFYMAYGCNALSHASLMVDNDSPVEHEPMLSRIAAWRPYYQKLAHLSEMTRPGGLGIVLSATHYKNSGGIAFDWAKPGVSGAYPLALAGVPMAFGDSFDGYILYPTAVDGMDETELRTVLSSGVLTCGETIRKIKQRGLAHLIGVDCEPLDFYPACELLTDNGYNGKYSGQRWQHFSLGREHAFYAFHNISSPDYHVLSEYLRYDEEINLTPIRSGHSSVVAQTALGGKIAIFGYNLWDAVISSARRAQLLAAADYITNKRLPAYVATTSQTVSVPRVDHQGRLVSVSILNASIDASPALTLIVRNPVGKHPRLVKPLAGDMILDISIWEDELTVHLPSLEAWNMFTVVFEH